MDAIRGLLGPRVAFFVCLPVCRVLKTKKKVKHGSPPSDAAADRSSRVGLWPLSLCRRSCGLSAGLQGAAGVVRPARRAGAACLGAGRAALARVPAAGIGKPIRRMVLEGGYQERQRRALEWQ